jgi:hypothetical protein
MTITGFVERTAFRAALWILCGLDPVRAFNLGAAVAGRIGPPLPVLRVAERNLSLAFLSLGAEARGAYAPCRRAWAAPSGNCRIWRL